MARRISYHDITSSVGRKTSSADIVPSTFRYKSEHVQRERTMSQWSKEDGAPPAPPPLIPGSRPSAYQASRTSAYQPPPSAYPPPPPHIASHASAPISPPSHNPPIRYDPIRPPAHDPPPFTNVGARQKPEPSQDKPVIEKKTKDALVEETMRQEIRKQQEMRKLKELELEVELRRQEVELKRLAIEEKQLLVAQQQKLAHDESDQTSSSSSSCNRISATTSGNSGSTVTPEEIFEEGQVVSVLVGTGPATTADARAIMAGHAWEEMENWTVGVVVSVAETGSTHIYDVVLDNDEGTTRYGLAAHQLRSIDSQAVDSGVSVKVSEDICILPDPHDRRRSYFHNTRTGKTGWSAADVVAEAEAQPPPPPPPPPTEDPPPAAAAAAAMGGEAAFAAEAATAEDWVPPPPPPLSSLNGSPPESRTQTTRTAASYFDDDPGDGITPSRATPSQSQLQSQSPQGSEVVSRLQQLHDKERELAEKEAALLEYEQALQRTNTARLLAEQRVKQAADDAQWSVQLAKARTDQRMSMQQDGGN